VSIDFRVRAVQTVCIKSWTAVDFIGWVSGRNPDLKTIFASFSDELGMRTNKDLQRIFDDDRFKMLFPKTKLGMRGQSWQRRSPPLAIMRPRHQLVK
jgi:hypothetical protein